MPELRSHPDILSWPPDWAGSYSGGDIMPIGEVGTLTSAIYSRQKGYLVLKIKFKGNDALGIVNSKDPKFLAGLEKKLAPMIGKTMAEVGGLDV